MVPLFVQHSMTRGFRAGNEGDVISYSWARVSFVTFLDNRRYAVEHVQSVVPWGANLAILVGLVAGAYLALAGLLRVAGRAGAVRGIPAWLSHVTSGLSAACLFLAFAGALVAGYTVAPFDAVISPNALLVVAIPPILLAGARFAYATRARSIAEWLLRTAATAATGVPLAALYAWLTLKAEDLGVPRGALIGGAIAFGLGVSTATLWQARRARARA
jgi:hypothetical protein